MAEINAAPPNTLVSFCSSLKDDKWHDQPGAKAFESWHFDAVSDDGREALVIVFYDNYVLSPRYFENHNFEVEANGGIDVSKSRFPAISFAYSVDGKTVISSISEYGSDAFSSSPRDGKCALGKSSFQVEAAEYGSGFVIRIDIGTFRKWSIIAELEWLFVESDLMPRKTEQSDSTWNMVAPRSDVSGRISLIGRRGKTRKVIHFRGTGYHDHICYPGPVTGGRLWGRAHFVDTTVIFESSSNAVGVPSKLFMVRDGAIHERNVTCDATEIKRDRYGLKIPRRISFISGDSIRLRVKPMSTIRSCFSEVKMLSEITLMLRDGNPRKTLGITEFVDAGRMKNRFLRRLTDLRIGRGGRSPLF